MSSATTVYDFTARGLDGGGLISKRCLRKPGNLLHMFLHVCRRKYGSQTQEPTNIFEYRRNYWVKTSSKGRRPLSTVIIDALQQKKLVDDIRDFLHLRTRTWYNHRGIPYRRGYLLYGPPGTGKSSLSAAIAGEFGLDIYILSIRSIDDKTLAQLFRELPETCIILLEDIDAVGTDGSQASFAPNQLEHAVSRSALLNTLDGVTSQEGHIVLMTATHIEKLDEALIRPGRIDLKIELGLADAIMATKLFGFMYGPDREVEFPKTLLSLEIEDLAAQFAEQVPEYRFSPAQIMSHLIQHRSSPAAALENTQDWVKTTLLEQEVRLQNAGSQDPLSIALCDTATRDKDRIRNLGDRPSTRL